VSPVANNRRQRARVSALLTDTPVKVASEPEVRTRAKSAKCNRRFSDVQEEEENESFCVDCVEPYSIPRAPTK
jgi:hypothetical protein